MKKIIITGGGTGGHIYPAIEIARAALENGLQVLYVGRRAGMEEEISREYRVPFLGIPAASFSRSQGSMIRKIPVWCKAVLEGFRIVRENNPALAIGTGGYVSGPVLLAAELSGVPLFLQEQNAIPGKTNRMLSFFAEKIFIPFIDTKKYFWTPRKCVVAGNPVRAEFFSKDENRVKDLREKMNIGEGQKILLVTGGSQGAHGINELVSGSIPYFEAHRDVFILWLTGKKEYKKYSEQSGKRVKVLPYMEDMASAMAAADLIISRAGAIALSEIMTVLKPSILVPFPQAAQNHQEANAKIFEKAGCAKILHEDNLSASDFYSTVSGLLMNQGELHRMECRITGFGFKTTTEIIMNEVIKFIKKAEEKQKMGLAGMGRV